MAAPDRRRKAAGFSDWPNLTQSQGTEALYQNVKARLDEQMELFQGHALHGCLQIPPGLDMAQVRHFPRGFSTS